MVTHPCVLTATRMGYGICEPTALAYKCTIPMPIGTTGATAAASKLQMNKSAFQSGLEMRSSV